MEQWTIQKLLGWITDYFGDNNIDSPRLSAELLLSHILKMQRIELYTQFDRIVAKPQLDKLHALVKRCAAGEPVAYLTGLTGFYSLDIKVTSACLIPRPETELLVERAIEFLRTRSNTQLVLDLCTGSGCIAVAIAKNFNDCNIIATDICDSALTVAAENIDHHQLTDHVRLLCGDLFDPLITGLDESRFDLVVCNPPYISDSEFQNLDRNVKDHEPKKALHAGADGMDIYRRITERIGDFLKPDATLILEIGYAQGKDVTELLQQTGLFTKIKIEKDLTDNDRIVIAGK